MVDYHKTTLHTIADIGLEIRDLHCDECHVVSQVIDIPEQEITGRMVCIVK
jgi:hypothetical protein